MTYESNVFHSSSGNQYTISVPVLMHLLMNKCVFLCSCAELYYPLINIDTLAKVTRKLIYSLSRWRKNKTGRCAEVISATPAFVSCPSLGMHNIWIFYYYSFFWRSGQDHLCRLETYCVPMEPNNEETNFLFCWSYVNHVISKSSQNILEEERKGVFHFKETLEFHSFYCLWLSSILNENLPDLLTYYTSACYSLLQLCDFLCNGHKEIALASFHPL